MALGLVIPALLCVRKLYSLNQKIGLGLIGLLALGLMISTLATDVKYTAIFGEFHRNNGALSYISMIILMIAGSLVFSLKSVNRYFTYFGIGGLLLTFYGLLIFWWFVLAKPNLYSHSNEHLILLIADN
jgi:hypothetical protein